MLKYLTNLNIKFDEQKLLDDFHSVKFLTSDKFSPNPYNTAWLKGRVNHQCDELLRIKNYLSNKLNCKVSALCYIQEKNKEILSHKDTSCHTSINILLSKNAAPVCFEDQYLIEYNCAILNVGEFLHSVPAFSEDRKIVRFAIDSTALDYYKICKILTAI